MANRELAKAQASLELAHEKLDSRQKGKIFEAEIDALLGDVFMQLNSFSAAQSSYLEAAKVYQALGEAGKEAEIKVRYARALQGSPERPKAVADLLALIRRNPNDAELHRQTKSMIRELSSEDLNKVSHSADCAHAEDVGDECALLSVQQAARLSANSDPLPEPQILSLATTALDFKIADPQIRAEALCYAARAALHLEKYAEANSFLVTAEALPPQGVNAGTRDWILRLRGVYWLAQENYESAYKLLVPAAHDKGSSRYTTLLAAQASFLWGYNLQPDPARTQQANARLQEARDLIVPLVTERYTIADELLFQVNHALGKDQDTRDRFLEIIDKNPGDDSASRLAILTCTELLADYDCSFSVAKKSASSGFASKAPELQLDMVEAAMLKGDAKQAKQWLKLLRNDADLSPELKMVRDFYLVWTSLSSNDIQTAQASFSKWRDGTSNLRQRKTPVAWSFKAAKGLLKEKQSPDSSLILGMIEAVENDNAAIPKFTVSPGL
jgi:tetratricopeptide (TPR) repeat protein